MRLVDVDKIELDYSGLAHISPYDFIGTTKYFVDQIKSMPAADAVEVVRCEKCRHWHRCMQGDVEILAFSKCLKGNPLGNGNNYFCADGERKEATE